MVYYQPFEVFFLILSQQFYWGEAVSMFALLVATLFFFRWERTEVVDMDLLNKCDQIGLLSRAVLCIFAEFILAAGYRPARSTLAVSS